jgi:hypothetical protein
MKNWIFQIKFSGLTAFVMRRDRSGSRVFLINALNPTNELNPDDKKHRPELRFDDRDKQPSPWKFPEPTDICSVDPRFPFENSDAKMSPGKILFPENDADVNPFYPNRKRWLLKFLDLDFFPPPGVSLKGDFVLDPSIDFYLTKFETIFSEASEIDPDCFALTPPDDLVVVRVPLRHGKLTKTMLAFEQLGEDLECGFAPKGEYNKPILHKQFCAVEVALEFTVEEGPLTLVGVPFDGSYISGIALEPPRGKREVVVELENRPVGKEKSRRIGDKELDEDFSLHYNLSSKSTPDEKRVVPLYEHILRAESGNCILGRFADSDSA